MSDHKKQIKNDSAFVRKLEDALLQSRTEDPATDHDPDVSDRLRWLRQRYRERDYDSIIGFHLEDIKDAPDEVSIEGCVYGGMSLNKRGRRTESLASLFVGYAYADEGHQIDRKSAIVKSRILNQAGIRMYHLSEEKDFDRPLLMFKKAWQFCMTCNEYDYTVIVNWAAMILQRTYHKDGDMEVAIKEVDDLFDMLLQGWPSWQDCQDFIDLIHRDVSLQDYIGSPLWKNRFGMTQPS